MIKMKNTLLLVVLLMVSSTTAYSQYRLGHTYEEVKKEVMNCSSCTFEESEGGPHINKVISVKTSGILIGYFFVEDICVITAISTFTNNVYASTIIRSLEDNYIKLSSRKYIKYDNYFDISVEIEYDGIFGTQILYKATIR